MTPSPRSLARAPLLHFALIGATLFAADLLLNPDAPEPIVVPRAWIDAQRAEIEARTGAPPSDEALAAAAQSYALEEALFREALSIGLHRHDLIVRRRLVQQVEFLHLDLAVPSEPDDDLAQWLLDHPEDYRAPERRSLEHRFFSRDKRKARAPLDALDALRRLDPEAPALNAERHDDPQHSDDPRVADLAPPMIPDARRAGSLAATGDDPRDDDLAGLGADAGADGLGDPFPLGSRLLNQSRQDLTGRLGPEFAEAAFAQPLNQWSAPLRSAFGHHLVRVTEVVQAGPAPLDAVRQRVRADLMAQRRREAADAAARAALSRHRVIIEPEADRDGATP